MNGESALPDSCASEEMFTPMNTCMGVAESEPSSEPSHTFPIVLLGLGQQGCLTKLGVEDPELSINLGMQPRVFTRLGQCAVATVTDSMNAQAGARDRD